MLALLELAEQENCKLEMTLLAQYRPAENKIQLKFMDYDPAQATASYAQYPSSTSVQVLKRDTSIANQTIQMIYNTPATKYYVYMRSVPGYKFRGWFTAPNGGGTKAFEVATVSNRRIMVGAEDVLVSSADSDGVITLYSYYEKIQYDIIDLDFFVKATGGAEHLDGMPQYGLSGADAQYIIRYDREQGYDGDVTMPLADTLKFDSVYYKGKTAGDADAVPPSTEINTANVATTNKIHVHIEPSASTSSDTVMHKYDVYLNGENSVDALGYVIRYEMNNTPKNMSVNTLMNGSVADETKIKNGSNYTYSLYDPTQQVPDPEHPDSGYRHQYHDL